MDCKNMKDRLLDYIDGELSKEEEEKLEIHLENCVECNAEYEKINLSIDYLVNNSNKIDTTKDLNLNPNIYKKKTAKRITRTGFIAIALSFIFVITAFATDIFGFMDWWIRSSEKQISAWEKLIENGVGQKLDISAVDKDIKVTAEGVIADELNTIILLKIEDLKESTRFIPVRTNSIWRPLIIDGDVKNKYDNEYPEVNYHSLYTEDEGTVKLLVTTEPLNKDKGSIKINLSQLGNMGNSDKGILEGAEITLEGNWNLNISTEKIKSKSYKIHEAIDLDGNELIIEEIVIAPTVTSIKYKIERYNKEKNYFIDDITFLISRGEEVYRKGEFSPHIIEEYKKNGYSRGEYHLQSLYLEDPKDIDLVVNTYRYTTEGFKEYDIDIENLPQTIEYDGSQITIRDIVYKEDSTDIIIEEDHGKDREYIKSNIYLWKSGLEPEKDFNWKNSLQLKENIKREMRYGSIYPSNRSSTKHEVRDSTGKIEEDGRFWTEEMYAVILEWLLTVERSNIRIALKKEFTDDHLIPDKLIIDGQEYIKYPNIKKNIKLK